MTTPTRRKIGEMLHESEREGVMENLITTVIERRRIFVQGIVQGVGFRPFVYAQALHRSLVGFVRNDSSGVTIEVEGTAEVLDGFSRALREEAPPLARIDSTLVELVTLRNETAFVIAHSQAGGERSTLISPDTVICDECLCELFDPSDRRYHYPFINCTNCGPRFTIVQDVPYDRNKTTMRSFPMCPTCQAEYDNPYNRRFHAQPNACSNCGPQAQLLNWANPTIDNEDAITKAAQLLARGAILAIKGLGGYHLACDALNEEAVRRLRQKKHREAKPFALMVPDLQTAKQLCHVGDAEVEFLQSRQRPIVLLNRLPNSLVAPNVSLVNNTLGIMVPYTPLHHLLLHAFAAAIAEDRIAVLVMTSGNVSDEPIAYEDADAYERLASIAEGVLTHNRDIHMRCDDSVLRIAAGGEQFLRRSRGYAPEPLPLSFNFPVPLLACGGHLKNTFCLGKGRHAFVSHHIGDLENLETLTSFREGIEHFQRLFDISPEAVVYDLHPEYLATKYAIDTSIPQKIGVQHHHAHIASVLAEHGLSGPIIGVAADGTGYGTDGAIWGCEIMTADLLGFERLAHLTYVPLPGGEQAVRQPWRMAAVYLSQTYGDAFLELDIPFVHQINHSKWRTLAHMITRGINSPPTSSLGRLFDAIAALVGLCSETLYEGQAAIELEVQAWKGTPCEYPQSGSYPFAVGDQRLAALDIFPMIRAIVGDIQQGTPIPQIARRFHYSIAELLATACFNVREQTGLKTVALSGGIFQNRLLLELLKVRLEEMAFQVYINRRVPPNDGGLSLGQAVVASARLQKAMLSEVPRERSGEEIGNK